MNLFNGYKYLYYRIYSSNLRDWGENDIPQFNALLGVSFLIYLNTFTLFIGVKLITEFRILEQIKFSKTQAVIGFMVIGLINYYIFIHASKYKLIAKQFNKESKGERKTRFYWCLFYVIFSFASFFVLLLILSPSSR